MLLRPLLILLLLILMKSSPKIPIGEKKKSFLKSRLSLHEERHIKFLFFEMKEI